MREDERLAVHKILRTLSEPGRQSAEQEVAVLDRGGASIFHDLEAAINNDDMEDSLREMACWLVGRLPPGDDSLRLLLTAAGSASPALRRAAVVALGDLQDRKAVPTLVRALEIYPDTQTRVMAAYALGALGGSQPADALLQAFTAHAQPPSVRGMAAEQLGSLRIRPAVPALISGLADGNVEVRFWSAFALGQIGDARAVPALRTLADNDKGFVKGHGSARNEARQALEAIHGGVE